MLTKEQLIEKGVDYEKGMKLCMNNETFYFKLIGQCLSNDKFAELGIHIDDGNLQSAFEAAHALKGICGNLALTPLFDAVNNIVEPLRAKDSSPDYKAMYAEIIKQKESLEELL